MNEQRTPSPRFMKKTHAVSASNLHKSGKIHLPSRYAHEKSPNRSGNLNILNSIETNIKVTEIARTQPGKSPGREKVKDTIPGTEKTEEPTQFRPRPMKRNQSDLQKFKEIFLDPRKHVLDELHEKAKTSYVNEAKFICKEYERLLQFQNGDDHREKDRIDEIKDNEVSDHIKQCISILETAATGTLESKLQNVYDEQIKIEPPDLPNGSTASNLSPGSGYAPSVPLNLEKSGKAAKLKELLMRAKAGMNTEDVEKEAHLSFYLGIVYEQKRKYVQAVKFYRRFLGFAKALEDKIGMALGANHVAINYYYAGDTNRSISFHNENLKLSDNENCFAGFYNLGICSRKLRNFDEALEYFQTALQWAVQNGEPESECICLGQLGVTYKIMEQYQSALQNFEKSLQICRKLKKFKLQETNLLNILLISSKFKLQASQGLEEISQEAYQCAKILGQSSIEQIFSCNIGIIRGKQVLQDRSRVIDIPDDIQELENEEQGSDLLGKVQATQNASMD